MKSSPPMEYTAPVRSITAVALSVIFFVALACKSACPELVIRETFCHSEEHEDSASDTCVDTHVVLLQKTFEDALPVPLIAAANWLPIPSDLPLAAPAPILVKLSDE